MTSFLSSFPYLVFQISVTRSSQLYVRKDFCQNAQKCASVKILLNCTYWKIFLTI